MLEARGQPYVLAVRGNHTLRFLEDRQRVQTDPATIAADLEADQWRTLTAGEGAKGPRLYEWARVSLGQGMPNGETPAGFERWLLLRRHRHDRNALAYFIAYAPAGSDLADLAGAAGLRWTIEECFLHAKDDLGLDHCEARSWHGWHRHMSLVMAAAAFLAKLAADQRRTAFTKADKTSPAAMSEPDKPCPATSQHPNCAR
jgi:SRSO17 transposase